MTMIDRFEGEFFFLSNFYERPIFYNGKIWPSNEHAFQAMKTEDPKQKERIRLAAKPGQAKRMGRQVTLRQDWEEMKVATMITVVAKKFSQHEDLAQKLLATGDAELIEGNRWGDKFWGVVDGHGENWLGKILMTLRSNLRA